MAQQVKDLAMSLQGLGSLLWRGFDLSRDDSGRNSETSSEIEHRSLSFFSGDTGFVPLRLSRSFGDFWIWFPPISTLIGFLGFILETYRQSPALNSLRRLEAGKFRGLQTSFGKRLRAFLSKESR